MGSREILKKVQDILGAKEIAEKELIQQLWSGYGSLYRCDVKGLPYNSIILKHIKTQAMSRHPRGWNTSLSHDRKVNSYNVEIAWYKNFANGCDLASRVPNCLALFEMNGEQVIVMEDLEASGFYPRQYNLSFNEIFATLKWLANFHATHMGVAPVGLWDIGTYWHLDTRPEELEAMSDLPLKKAAKSIDEHLNGCVYQTLVHGDAKVANFCYSEEGNQVAGVDFQYVGAGCGMKDVAYFISSCLYEEDCEHYEQELLDCYFGALKEALILKKPQLNVEEVLKEWRSMYIYAWTDFYRFLQGWSPDHWKINGYNQKLAKKVINELKSGGKR
ncbi:ecdysteroid 22-kinase family protein [Halosquirtibacter laminarini]|uniref:Ecdysteroid 22-kinase family protein n=1 Tax=Halosquirtibacter laminarini TaxID=3374600 RepID=A0AC61NK92_9BACT|nr:ecdysteroid 22-kinase family protein [Prolixibacteraceae bacterium]